MEGKHSEHKDAPKEYGLSISTIDKGFNMVPDAFSACEAVFETLFERWEEEMMKKRVETEYKKYAVMNNVQTMMNALNISNISNDPGDKFDAYPIHDFEPYNYVEESTEPAPAPLDSHGQEGKMGDPAKLNCRFRVSQFNKLFQAGTKENSPRRKPK